MRQVATTGEMKNVLMFLISSMSKLLRSRLKRNVVQRGVNATCKMICVML